MTPLALSKFYENSVIMTPLALSEFCENSVIMYTERIESWFTSSAQNGRSLCELRAGRIDDVL